MWDNNKGTEVLGNVLVLIPNVPFCDKHTTWCLAHSPIQTPIIVLPYLIVLVTTYIFCQGRILQIFTNQHFFTQYL